MNVKAGDLAIVVSSNSKYNGRIVIVIAPAPACIFRLPCGHMHAAPRYFPAWIIKAVGGPLLAPLEDGGVAWRWYGCGADRQLRPLPGDHMESNEPECIADYQSEVQK